MWWKKKEEKHEIAQKVLKLLLEVGGYISEGKAEMTRSYEFCIGMVGGALSEEEREEEARKAFVKAGMELEKAQVRLEWAMEMISYEF